MAKRIYKYPLKMEDVQTVEMIKNSEILTVQEQDNSIYLWAMVDTEMREVNQSRRIHIIDIGRDIPYVEMKYLGTVQTKAGYNFVWHIFEEV